ncbi:TauD/TfdA family dioxygenase [Lichenicoccus roseus]|uniref:TauD/TfdA family dioxygenase n=1 Tax=Lichenicoccus roseus TaxID=2683649 RepID=A0A5R9IYS3_9PROT|nr:TauD/TfdA family dioxygenase [Lichenicoccus roseus]
MSAQTGLDAQPRHTDAAFLPRPPRYIALQCLKVGEGFCPTILWPIQIRRLSRKRPPILFNSRWVSTAAGHSPMYCYVAEDGEDGLRIRFDPLSMRLLPSSYWELHDVEIMLDEYTNRVECIWKEGALLIINNWTCLHARGEGAVASPSRVLRRWAVGVI